MRKKNSTHPNQLVLPGIESAPPKVRAHGLTRGAHLPSSESAAIVRAAPSLPAASQRPKRGTTQRLSFVPRTLNPASCWTWTARTRLERVLWSVEKGRVLQPNWMVTRKDGGGTHMVYTLARPVLTRAGHAGRADPAVRARVRILR